jgi:transcriptional regulator with XRE-family HTH domain
MPTLRHEDVRDELFAGLSDAGRRQFDAFAAVYEARQVASRLAELRTTARLSQREAARRAGIDQGDLSRIESAQITPSLPTLLRLLDVVGGSLVLARKTITAGQGSKVVKTPSASTAKGATPVQREVVKQKPARTSSARPARSTKRTATKSALGTAGQGASARTSTKRTAAKKSA